MAAPGGAASESGAGASPGANGQYGAAGWQVSYALAGVRQPGEHVDAGQAQPDATRFGDRPTSKVQHSGAGAEKVSESANVVPQSDSRMRWLRGKRAGVLVVAGVALLVAVVAGATVLNRLPHRATAAQRSVPPSRTEATLGPDTTTTDAMVQGYQGVAVPALGIGYDVPTGWIIEPASTTWTIGGFTGHGQADEGAHYCPGSGFRAVATLTDSGQGDPAQAATAVGTTAAQTSYGGSGGGTAAPAAELTTRSGITGQYVETSGAWTPSRSGCSTTTFSVYTFAFRAPSGSVLVLAVLADRGTAGELTPAQAREILTSVRELR
ncbi:hypothetical protein K7711_15680 [Nocardia sp. CA2R105]|uniref:hypothetical protein n=1 Tax=Nocardia coffeae TaxID=2873381 RepID=UPI001CA78DC0|nr:hypothetical protein [Nocardia coffeae]MBY8857927.1 hypothetical protein [Nocardia coffeae]